MAFDNLIDMVSVLAGTIGSLVAASIALYAYLRMRKTINGRRGLAPPERSVFLLIAGEELL
jgi:hypothetical protein